MDRKKKIIRLYYDEKMKATDIAKKCKVSNQYVSEVIQKDQRYNNEKESRKEQVKINKKNYTDKKIKEIRDRNVQLGAYMEQQHLQASRELSGGRSIISNRAFWEWNKSAYKYNKSKKCYEFDKKLTRSYAVPRYIK